MSAKNQELIRDLNARRILETLIERGTASRAELAKCLGLTKATISSQIQSLLDHGLAEEIGSPKTCKGRRPILLTFNRSHAYIASFDLTPTGIHLMTADLLGRDCILHRISWDKKRESLPALLISSIQKLRTHPDRPLAGICLGIHGVVHENQILFTPYYDLAQLPLKELLEDTFSLPVLLENEANLSALGEAAFSFGAGNLVNISVHTGIGLGIIFDGQLYTGADGFAGEFGHTIVQPQGRPCPCGNRGWLEHYAPEDAILRKYRALKRQPHASLDDLIQDYRSSGEAARAAVEDFLSYLALGINNLANLFNPQLIVINSALSAGLPEITPKLLARLTNPMSRKCRIEPSTLQDTAALLGGVCLGSKQYLNIERYCPSPK